MTFEEAVAAHRAGDFERAERGYAQHLSSPRALHNLGVIFSITGRCAEAETALRASLAKRPGHSRTLHSLALLLLRLGRWDEAWPLYESRRLSGNPDIAAPPVGFPEWQGEPLAGKRLMVYREQGLGDEIMFARFSHVLAGLGATVRHVTYPGLVPLFHHAGLDASENLRSADYWILSGSIPLRLSLRPGALPLPLDLRVPRGGGRGLGVCPSGSSRHANDLNRSLRGADAERLLRMGRDLRPEATGARNLLETAAIVRNLSAVLTVDTSLAHLAASLGVMTFVLLPARGADWRWGEVGRSIWYPEVRLIPQRTHGDWSEALEMAERLVSEQCSENEAVAAGRSA